MKYLVGFVVALLLMIGLNLLNKYALTFEIPQFLIGWMSYAGYTASRDIYEAERHGG